MKLVSAVFDFGVGYVDFRDVRIRVWLGKPDGAPALTVDRGDWRPCVTHARELVRMAKGQPAQGTHAKQRREKVRPALRIADCG